MGSNKHRRIGALAGHRGARLPGKEGTGRRECNVREIPMLSMFLQVTFCEFCKISEMLKKKWHRPADNFWYFQRLHQHHYFPPIRVTPPIIITLPLANFLFFFFSLQYVVILFSGWRRRGGHGNSPMNKSCCDLNVLMSFTFLSSCLCTFHHHAIVSRL